MRFAHPVLQERARIAEQSLRARVRLSDGTTAGSLEQFMVERLRLLGADLDAVRWDAMRSADGSWTVTGTWAAGANSGVTAWVFDIPARQVTPADAATRDFAEGTRLVRVVPEVPGGSGPVPRPAAPATPPPSTAIQNAPEPAAEPEPAAPAVPPEPFGEDISEHDTIVLGRTDDGEDDDPRARVPAWEDIVFGIRRHR
jgi:hypothetical protein